MKNLQARIPTELHTWLKIEAIRRGTTIADMIADMIKREQEEQK